MAPPVYEIGRLIDTLLATADRRLLVELLATLKHREVLIVEALRNGPPLATAALAGVTMQAVARAFRVSTRTVYRMARRPPLHAYAMWDGRRLRGFLPGVRSILPEPPDEPNG
jgi:hypothetical protein